MVDAQLGDERPDHLRKAAAHHGQFVAESFQGAHQGARARGEHNAVAHGLEVAFLHAGQEAHPWRSASAKSTSPAMAAAVTAATSGPQPQRSAIRSIISPCSKVESASSTIRCFARRCSPAACTATSTRHAPPPRPARRSASTSAPATSTS